MPSSQLFRLLPLPCFLLYPYIAIDTCLHIRISNMYSYTVQVSSTDSTQQVYSYHHWSQNRITMLFSTSGPFPSWKAFGPGTATINGFGGGATIGLGKKAGFKQTEKHPMMVGWFRPKNRSNWVAQKKQKLPSNFRIRYVRNGSNVCFFLDHLGICFKSWSFLQRDFAGKADLGPRDSPWFQLQLPVTCVQKKNFTESLRWNASRKSTQQICWFHSPWKWMKLVTDEIVKLISFGGWARIFFHGLLK